MDAKVSIIFDKVVMNKLIIVKLIIGLSGWAKNVWFMLMKQTEGGLMSQSRNMQKIHFNLWLINFFFLVLGSAKQVLKRRGGATNQWGESASNIVPAEIRHWDQGLALNLWRMLPYDISRDYYKYTIHML